MLKNTRVQMIAVLAIGGLLGYVAVSESWMGLRAIGRVRERLALSAN